jgi:hypothetical protein
MPHRHRHRLLSRGIAPGVGAIVAFVVSFAFTPSVAAVSQVGVSAAAPVVGTIDYRNASYPAGIPSLLVGGCSVNQASLSATAAEVAVETHQSLATSPFVGTVGLSAPLIDTVCTNIGFELASVSNATLSGVGPNGSTISCGPFSGYFDRVGTQVLMDVQAPSCTVDGDATGRVVLLLTGEWVPTGSTSAGINSPIATATVAATLVLESVS